MLRKKENTTYTNKCKFMPKIFFTIIISTLFFSFFIGSVNSQSQQIIQFVYEEDFGNIYYPDSENVASYAYQYIFDDICFHFSNFEPYTSDISESGSEFDFAFNSSQTIIIPEVFQSELYRFEHMNSLQFSNGSLQFYWSSSNNLDNVYTSFSLLANNLDDILFDTRYYDFNLQNISDSIHINGTNTNISTVNNLKIDINYLFSSNILQFKMYDFENTDEFYLLQYPISKINNTIHMGIINNKNIPINLFGLGIDSKSGGYGIRSNKNNFNSVEKLFGSDIYYYQEFNDTDIDYQTSTITYNDVEFDNSIREEYKGFMTFSQEILGEGFGNGSQSINLLHYSTPDFRNNTDVVGRNGGNIGYSYGNLSYVCSESILFENAIFLYGEDSTYHQNNFTGSGLEFSTIDYSRNVSIWIGLRNFYDASLDLLHHTVSLYIRDNDVYTFYNLKNHTYTDDDLDTGKNTELRLGFRTSNDTLFIYENGTIFSLVSFNFTDLNILTRFSLNSTGSMPYQYHDSLGIRDYLIDNPYLYNGRYEFWELGKILPNIIYSNNVYGFLANYSTYYEDYVVGGNNQIFGKDSGYTYLSQYLDVIPNDEENTYDVYTQIKAFGNLSIDCKHMEIFVGHEDEQLFILDYVYITDYEAFTTYDFYTILNLTINPSYKLFIYYLFEDSLLSNLTDSTVYIEVFELYRSEISGPWDQGNSFDKEFIIGENLNETYFDELTTTLLEYNYTYYYLQSSEISVKITFNNLQSYVWIRIKAFQTANLTLLYDQISRDAVYVRPWKFEIDYNDLLSARTVLQIQTFTIADNELNLSMSIVMEQTFLGSEYDINYPPLAEEDLWNDLLNDLILLGVNSGVLLTPAIILSKKHKSKGFGLGLLIGCILSVIIGTFDFVTIVIVLVSTFSLSFYIFTQNKREVLLVANNL